MGTCGARCLGTICEGLWALAILFLAGAGYFLTRPFFRGRGSEETDDEMQDSFGDVPHAEALHQAQRPARDFATQPVMFPPVIGEGGRG